MHHSTAECKVLSRHRMLFTLKGELGNSNRWVLWCFYTAFVKIMFIFDRSLTKHEALTKPYQLTINSQISSFGSSPSPKKEEKKMENCIAFRDDLQNNLWSGKHALWCEGLDLLYWTTFERLLNQNLQVPTELQDFETTLIDEGKTNLSDS